MKRRLAKGLFKIAGWVSSAAFQLAGDPLTPKKDRIKFGDEDEEEDEEPVGVGASTEGPYDPLTSEAQAMIAPPDPIPKKKETTPLEGSVEARMGKTW